MEWVAVDWIKGIPNYITSRWPKPNRNPPGVPCGPQKSCPPATSPDYAQRLSPVADSRRGPRSDRVRSSSLTQFGLRGACRTVVKVLGDLAHLGFLTLHSHTQLSAENLFLRKQVNGNPFPDPDTAKHPLFPLRRTS